MSPFPPLTSPRACLASAHHCKVAPPSGAPPVPPRSIPLLSYHHVEVVVPKTLQARGMPCADHHFGGPWVRTARGGGAGSSGKMQAARCFLPSVRHPPEGGHDGVHGRLRSEGKMPADYCERQSGGRVASGGARRHDGVLCCTRAFLQSTSLWPKAWRGWWLFQEAGLCPPGPSTC